MKKAQLYEMLKLHPESNEARQVALQILEETSTDESGFKHIFDVETMRWQKEFEANGQRYIILGPKDGIGLRRYRELRQSVAVVLNDATFADQKRNIDDAINLVDRFATEKSGIVKLSVILNNMSRAISNSSRKWDYAVKAATYFIVRPDEDRVSYDESLAEEKMNDWNVGKIYFPDLFFCCWAWENQWNTGLQEFVVRLV